MLCPSSGTPQVVTTLTGRPARNLHHRLCCPWRPTIAVHQMGLMLMMYTVDASSSTSYRTRTSPACSR